jgi:hypothetical protein
MVFTYPSCINVVKSCSLQHESLTMEPAIVALTANHHVPIEPTIRPKGTAGTAATATAMGKKATTVVASSLVPRAIRICHYFCLSQHRRLNSIGVSRSGMFSRVRRLPKRGGRGPRDHKVHRYCALEYWQRLDSLVSSMSPSDIRYPTCYCQG